jgi:NAD-dependent SIR2 family protein deacetylase
MTYQEFTADASGRRRYWARSFIGWPRIAAARPNAGHRAVAALEAGGLIAGTITQNVDGLHHAASSRTVIDLHGRLNRVICMACGVLSERLALQDRLRRANPDFPDAAAPDGPVNPDGDIALPEHLVQRFVTVTCDSCGLDALKPDVVFFGESVPASRVRQCWELMERARTLLVLGSSLTVMSGYRFVLRANGLGIPVGIVNAGPTRGDGRAAVRLDAPLTEVLTHVVSRLLPSPRGESSST